MNLLEIRQRISMGESIYDLPLRVTYYARVSTDKDSQINSLNNQILYYTNFIKSIPNWVYIEGYIDEGISGISVEKRDNFLRMIKDSSNDKFDLILTKEISRFSRNTLDSIKYTEELLNNNVGVLFQTDNINTIMPDSELRLTIMSSIAQEEVRKLSERVKFGFKRSMEKGRVLGNNSIIGYDKKDGKLTINEKEAEVVRIIFKMYSTGKYGLKAISSYLFNHGFKNKKGGYYSNSTIKGIITNPKYKGFYCANKYKCIDFKSKKKITLDKDKWIIRKDDVGNVPSIIDEIIWKKANDILVERNSSYSSHIKDSNSFKTTTTYGGKLFCFEHNKPFRRHIDYRSKKCIWICDELHKKGIKACRSAILKEEELDKIFKYVINNIINKNDIINHLYSLYSNISDYNYYEIENKKISDKINDLICKKNRIIDLLISDILSKDEYLDKVKDINNSIKMNEELINKLNKDKEKENNIINKEDIEDKLNSKEIYNELFRLIINKVIVHKIKEDRHNVKLEIYTNYYDKKIEITNSDFFNNDIHSLCFDK